MNDAGESRSMNELLPIYEGDAIRRLSEPHYQSLLSFGVVKHRDGVMVWVRKKAKW